MNDLFGNLDDITFGDFWLAYPKKKGGSKKQASAQWDKLTEIDKNEIMGDLHDREQLDALWNGSKGERYIPHAVRYIRDKRWTDDYEKCRADSGQSLDERRKVNW